MSRYPIHVAYKTLLDKSRLSKNIGQSALVDRLARLQKVLDCDAGPQIGLYIYGDVGTGKSHLADLFVATVPRHISTRRVHFNEFMMDIHARLHRARSQSTYMGDPLVKIGHQVKSESRVLCFDEFQVTDIADAMILKRLLVAFWESGGVMVSTSNRHPTQLYERGLNRALFLPFIDELQRRCEVWKLDGDRDYRTESRDRVPVFFTSAQGFVNDISLTTGRQTLKPFSIPVMMNRSLQVEACSLTSSSPKALAAKTTFQALCERPLGSSDYHALCARASTIYISGLRQFQSDELDFIRRFITLIDLAYDMNTRIICLSSAPLHEVFVNIMNSNDGSPGMEINIRREGGSSSSMMSTFIGDTEWSATGLARASLASGGAGETDVRFAIARTLSRLCEMGWKTYGLREEEQA